MAARLAEHSECRCSAHAAAARGNPLLVPGSAQDTELYRRIAGLSAGPRMPLAGTLFDVEIDTIPPMDRGRCGVPEGTGAAAEHPPD